MKKFILAVLLGAAIGVGTVALFAHSAYAWYWKTFVYDTEAR